MDKYNYNSCNEKINMENINDDIPYAIPCPSAPLIEDSWILLEQNNEVPFAKGIVKRRGYGEHSSPEDMMQSNLKINYFSKAKDTLTGMFSSKNNKKVKNIIKDTYKTIKNNPELGIITVGTVSAVAGISYVATKILLNGGLIYFCVKPNITVNITNVDKNK